MATLDKPALERTVATIGDSLIAAYHFKTLETGEIVYYSKEGFHKSGGRKIIEQTVRQQVDREISRHEMSEIIYYIENMTPANRAEFDKDPEWLHCANGWVNVYTGEFKDHSYEMLSLRKLPVPYLAGATCPQILSFLESTLDHESMAVVLRMIAYCLLPSNKYEKAFMLVGQGANGKSTLINVIKSLLGRENCSSVSLQDIASNRFAAAELQGRMVNLHPDLKADKVKDGGYFKALVSGDRLKVERKYAQPFDLENTAKLIFSANQIPETDDDSYAYFRRWVILPFNHTFEGDNRDTDLLAKLTSQEELAGLLYWALVCLGLLVKENGFQDTDIEDIRRQYQLGASKLDDFIKECCELGEDKRVRTTDFNNVLSNYLKAKGSNYLDVREVGRKMAALGIEHKQQRVKSDRPYFYIGIGLKSESVLGVLHEMTLSRAAEIGIVEGSRDESTKTTKTEKEVVTSPKELSNVEVAKN